MIIRPKSPELVQAQIAAFAAENVERFDARKAIFDRIGSLAAGNVAEVTYKTKSNEYLRDENGNLIIQEDDLAMIPEGTELTAATKDEYTRYLRSVGGSKHEAIAMRVSLLERYAEFEPEITPIIKELEEADSHKDHPAYLGSGTNISAFRISHGSEEYAVRLGGTTNSALGADVRADVTARAKDIPHLEQVVAISYDNSTIITELMPGKELGYDTLIGDIKQITNEQLSDLVDTVISAVEHGISIDPKPTNIFYDTEQGFGIIDLNPASSKTELGGEVGQMATSLSKTGFYGGDYNKITADAYARDLEYKKAHLDILTRYRAAVVAKLDGDALSNALETIDENIEYAHNSIKQLSDPNQVEAMIARAKEAKKPKTGSWTSV